MALDIAIEVGLLPENVTAESSTECQDLCSEVDTSGDECWAASFLPFLQTGVCRLYRNESIRAIQDYANMVNTPGSTLWFKKCLQGTRANMTLISSVERCYSGTGIGGDRMLL